MQKFKKTIDIPTEPNLVVEIQIYPFYGKSQGKANPHLVNVQYNGVVVKSREYNSLDLVLTNWLRNLEEEILADFRPASLQNVLKAIPEYLNTKGFIEF